MAKGSTFCNDFMKLLFNATAIANIADNAAASPLTSLYVSLHTASPGAGGNQTTNETSYTNYTRTAVARTSGGWTVSGAAASNTAAVSFPQCGASGATITDVAIGTASSSTGKLLYIGALTANLVVSNLITPQFAIGTLQATES